MPKSFPKCCPGQREGPGQQRNVAEYLRAGLKRIGIALQVRAAPDFPTWAQRVSNFDFDLTMDNVFNWGDPVVNFASVLTPPSTWQ